MIETLYRKQFLEDYIREQLSLGHSITGDDIEDILTKLDKEDLSTPQFVAANHKAPVLSIVSASAMNKTFNTIRRDLSILYTAMEELELTNQDMYERWKIEARNLENRLITLENRIENLLLLTQDTEGYFNILVDNFNDTSSIDTENSTANIDVTSNIITLSHQSTLFNKINLKSTDNISFQVDTSEYFVGRTDDETTLLGNILTQDNSIWGTVISTSKAITLTCSLLVKLDDIASISVSKIVLDLYDSALSGSLQITPLYSIDGYTFKQVPSSTVTQEVRGKCTFLFPTIQAQWFKFLLVKKGPDESLGGTFNYEFGFKSINFFNIAFPENETNSLITKPLYVLDNNKQVKSFSKVTLETCEQLEIGTSIQYYIAASNDSTVPIETSTWIPISPINRTEKTHPSILNIGEINDLEYTATISYNGTSTSNKNPASQFYLLTGDGDIGLTATLTTANRKRYVFKNTEDRLLNYQIDYGVLFNSDQLTLFRNVGEKGLSPLDTSECVRGIQRGWAFEDPYYTCTIEILNPLGMEIDVGSSVIYIDDSPYTGLINGNVLYGKTISSNGLHRIKIHKDNWKYVETGLSTLDELKAADILYPYNHKLLIEGYDYGTSYTEEEVYIGADLFFQNRMQQVNPFDFAVAADVINYNLFALDLDAPKIYQANPTTVFLVKTDISNSDFVNEQFLIRFELQNQTRNYLRLKADFLSEYKEASPMLSSYKIKLG